MPSITKADLSLLLFQQVKMIWKQFIIISISVKLYSAIYRGKGVNMGTLFCFFDKVTFKMKNSRFLPFINNYNKFPKCEKAKL